MSRRDPFPKWETVLEEVRQEVLSGAAKMMEEGATAPSSDFLHRTRAGGWKKTAKKYRFKCECECKSKFRNWGEEEMTHLCDTCKYREEECKPEDMQLDHRDNVVECFGYEEEEDETCSD